MKLPEKISEFAKKHHMFQPSGLILAAVSGGADSMCLLEALTELSAATGFSVAAVHFNHQLRAQESGRDEDFVKHFCRVNGIPIYTGSGDVRTLASERGLGIEEAARLMRYEFFDRTAEQTGAFRIATAHTADDNAETVLLNLTRGAGLKGLGGIPPVRGRIIRPMLTVTRQEVMDYLSRTSTPFVEDSSNGLDIYARNMIRHRVIPVLKELNPHLADRVAAAAALFREDEDYLNSVAERFIAENVSAENSRSLYVSAHRLADLPLAVSSRVVRLLAAGVRSHGQISSGHVSDVLALCVSESPSGEVSLPSVTVYREYDRIVFSACFPVIGFKPVTLTAGCRREITALGLSVSCVFYEPEKAAISKKGYFEKINKSFNTFLFKYDNVCGKIVIRPRQTGDKIELFGGNGTKTLKKLFIEKKIPVRRRAMIPVVADDAGVLAVYGIGADKRAGYDADSAGQTGGTILEITFEESGYAE